MLRRLRIENLVLIREAELSFGPGLNAVTGETGAGKTIFAQAIGLLLGSRADASAVGTDGSEAYVEAELDVPDGFFDEDDVAALAELRPEGEAGLVIARRVFGDGRTRAYAWGRAVAREDVAAAAERLIAMSGQFEQRRLARPAFQLDVLDAYCGAEQVELPAPGSRRLARARSGATPLRGVDARRRCRRVPARRAAGARRGDRGNGSGGRGRAARAARTAAACRGARRSGERRRLGDRPRRGRRRRFARRASGACARTDRAPRARARSKCRRAPRPRGAARRAGLRSPSLRRDGRRRAGRARGRRGAAPGDRRSQASLCSGLVRRAPRARRGGRARAG